MIEQLLQRDQSEFADGFVAGHFLHRRRNHVALPVVVWFGPPLDLEADEPGAVLDRSPRWQITIAGVLLIEHEQLNPYGAMARLPDVWPRAMRHPSDTMETQYRDARIKHAREHDPLDPFGDRYGKIDLLTAPLLF